MFFPLSFTSLVALFLDLKHDILNYNWIYLLKLFCYSYLKDIVPDERGLWVEMSKTLFLRALKITLFRRHEGENILDILYYKWDKKYSQILYSNASHSFNNGKILSKL